ncbi:NF038130 family PEP-CTERM protein [Anabaena lutea]|uniref:NF038130 family PEP-CTERM protein n=1 Tax=Anabaena lutea FACHB-196 TaxID=2692881 RepID=A0ABR8FK34_9NOST|nr:NF038130 family PEP-CTERM protein [Anabaena lutea]MBD2570493.1 NF038130 family PEP-CTERM protein [Anabaena lutea FACHB-196]
MKNTFGKLLVGASMAIGFGAAAANPAQAVSFSYNNPNQIKTYTGGSNGVFIPNNTAAATNALTDGDVTSNVELWYSDENPTANVGFTATQGAYSATVTSVTASDWNSFGSQWLGDLLSTYTPFQSVWNSFSANTKSLVTGYFPLLGMGDPNIGNFAFGQNGGVELKLIGHLDVKSKLSTTISTKATESWNGVKSQLSSIPTIPTLPSVPSVPALSTLSTQFSALSTLLSTLSTQASVPTVSQITDLSSKIVALPGQIAQLTAIKNSLPASTLKNQLTTAINNLNTLNSTLQAQTTQLTSFKDVLTLQTTLNGYQGPLQASEIAKVVTGGQTHYAYSFNPTASGITASDDGVSYNAIYTWNTPGYEAAAVPEPSAIFGVLGVAGILAAKRKLKKVSG